MRSKTAVVSVFIVGALVIGGAFAALAFAAPKCEGKVMAVSDTCLMVDDGQEVAYSYEEWQGYRAGGALFYALVALLVLGGLCFYLYPRRKKG